MTAPTPKRTRPAGEITVLVVDDDAMMDLILTDVAMPGGMGPQLAAEIRRANPQVRLLYISSYSRRDLLGHGIDLGQDDLLAKPFMPAQLIEQVRATLAQRRPFG